MNPSELSDKLWNDVERVVAYLLPNGKKSANEWVCGSVDGEKGNSLKVNMSGKRVWSDFSTGESGDLLDLWCAVKSCQLHVAMASGIRCCIASLELKPGKLLQRLTRQALCHKMPAREDVETAFEWYDDRLWLFNVTGTAKADRLLEIFAYARKRYGIQLFVIDSLMKCGLGEDDYNGQKDFVDRLCDFKNKNSCHIILVTHSRKSESEDKPTGKMDVKGTGAITDLTDNLFIIWRNKIREKALRKMADHGPAALDDKENKYVALPASILLLEKQRNGDGWEGQQPLWLDPESHQFLQAEHEGPLNYIANRFQHDIDTDWEMNNVSRDS